ncbi:MAG: hypothetical protein AAF468_10615 [Pseudomonadota bacterium]
MFSRLTKLGLVAAVSATAQFISATAQSNESSNDPVYVFNRICYAQVPNIQGIRNMALQLAWKQMGGEDLARFTKLKDPKVLEGWDAQVGERLFRVGVVQSDVPPAMQARFPDFAKGVSTSCSIVLDEEHKADAVAKNMQALAGKEPVSRDVADGDLLTTTWAGGNAEFKVFLVAKLSSDGAGGLLNVTILSKESGS